MKKIEEKQAEENKKESTQPSEEDYQDKLVEEILEKEAKVPVTPTNFFEEDARKTIDSYKSKLKGVTVRIWNLSDKLKKINSFKFEENIIDLIDQGISKLNTGIFHFSNLFRKFKEKTKI